MNICFIANFYKTIFFNEIAQKLKQNNVNVFWVTSKQNQYIELSEQWGKENVIKIDRSFINKDDQYVDDFKINELVFGDRVLKYEIENGISFLRNIQKPIYDFISRNKINFIVGEITWAHELLIHRLVNKRKELKCIYIEPSVVRLPNNRFAFFTNETQEKMLEFNEPIANEIIKLEVPLYLKLNDEIVQKNKSILSRLSRFKRFLTGENIEKNDPNVISQNSIRFKVKSSEEINKTTYDLIKRTEFKDIENEKYIFVGFHKQPEASVDVSGRYHENQELNIINLWRMLPNGWKLVVKEHTNAIGDRSLGFYKRLQSYPNIVIANEKINSKNLISKSQLVASVTGTISYEAALLGIPSITFSNVFFNKINYCKHVSIYDLSKYNSLIDLVEELKNVKDNRLEFSNYLLKNTFDGYITDPVTDPTVLHDDNLEKVTNAFLKLNSHIIV